MIFAVARHTELHQIRNPVVRRILVDVVRFEPSVGRTAQQALPIPLQNPLLERQKLAIVRIRLPSRSPVLVVANLAAELRTIRSGDRLLAVQTLTLHLAVSHRVVDLVRVVAATTAEDSHRLAVPIPRLLILRCAARKALPTAVAFERYGRLCLRFGIARPARRSVRSLLSAADRADSGTLLRGCRSRVRRYRCGDQW